MSRGGTKHGVSPKIPRKRPHKTKARLAAKAVRKVTNKPA